MINPAFLCAMFLCCVPLALYQRDWWLASASAALAVGFGIAWYRKRPKSDA